jgi:hypothetical protein
LLSGYTNRESHPPQKTKKLARRLTVINEFGVGKLCIVRTYSAGVHFGEMVDRVGMEVILKNARRIWYWNKAFTLSAVANQGAGEDSKLSQAVPEILLTEAIEIIPCSPQAADWLTKKEAHHA